MTTTGAVGLGATATDTPTPTPPPIPQGADKTTFLRLLVTQLKNQNP